jgi:hypothetical protein
MWKATSSCLDQTITLIFSGDVVTGVDKAIGDLLADLRGHGYQARLVSIDRVALLQKQLDGLRKKACLTMPSFKSVWLGFAFRLLIA